ncbi:MAG: GTPase [Planctomycetes bacterium]|nr:GTPase [Planctomycetota bacterium]
MVQINFAQRQVNAKVVYYGPGMSGKTTNLEVVHQRAPSQNRGDLTSISTDGDRTLFFDFMPLDLGTVAGMRTCFQIYTVPGQVYYNSTRKLVLQGVDGVVFVADSSASMVEENLESLRNLEENLREYGKSLATMPHIIQFNKRDLPDALPVDQLNQLLNAHNAPFFEAIANTGQGVFPTLKALAARVLETIHQTSGPSAPSGRPAAPQAQQQPRVAAQPAAPMPHQPVQAPPQRAPAPAMQAAQPMQAGFNGGFAQQAPMASQQGVDPLARTQVVNHGQPAPMMQQQQQPITQANFAPPRPIQQTGFHGQPAAPASGSLQLAQRQGHASQQAHAPMQQHEPARSAQGAPKKAQNPLEGTRFRPRMPRVEPQPTPTVKSSGGGKMVMMVAGALVVGGVATWLVLKFL